MSIQEQRSAPHRHILSKHGPHPVDVHVGHRLRLRRVLLGISQEKLAAAVSLTFQQVQKYEHGTNRISASRLWQFANVLEVPVSFFFDDMPAELRPGGASLVPAGASIELDTINRRETLEMVRAYYRIKSDAVRDRLFSLMKAMGN